MSKLVIISLIFVVNVMGLPLFLLFFMLTVIFFTIVANGLQIHAGGFSEHQLSIPTKGYTEDTCLLARRKQKSALAGNLSARVR